MSSKLMCAALFVLYLAAVGVPDDKKEEKKSVALPESKGIVVRVASTASGYYEDRADRLKFCVFENGAHDLIYVGMKSRLWAHGEFDLSFKDKVIYTGKVRYLCYEGTIIDMGDVIAKTDDLEKDLKVTRVKGWWK